MSRLLTAWLVLLMAACGGSSSSPPDAGDVVNCQQDPRVSTYSANMTAKSSSGAMVFTLKQAVPSPPARGNDTWTVHVTDAAGNPQPALALTVWPFMPDHGHGTPVNASVTAAGGGDYTVDPLNFFMPGVWRIRFCPGTHADCSQATDTTDFWFCIQG